MSKCEIKAVIFDVDGVLTDSEPLINAAAVAMLKEKGLEVKAEDFLPFVGTGEDRYIGGVSEKYHFSLDRAAVKGVFPAVRRQSATPRRGAGWFPV